MKTRQITALVAGAALATGAAAGPNSVDGEQASALAVAQAATPGSERFQALDSNRDGAISQQEVQGNGTDQARVRGQWQQADQNRDGQIDQGEFARFEQQQGTQSGAQPPQGQTGPQGGGQQNTQQGGQPMNPMDGMDQRRQGGGGMP